jgi:hypothetical protein
VRQGFEPYDRVFLTWCWRATSGSKGSSSNYLPASCRPQQYPPVLRILPEFWRHFGDGDGIESLQLETQGRHGAARRIRTSLTWSRGAQRRRSLGFLLSCEETRANRCSLSARTRPAPANVFKFSRDCQGRHLAFFSATYPQGPESETA